MANFDRGRRVVVTGAGVVSPIGENVPAFWASLVGGVTGIGPLEGLDLQQGDVRIGGQIKNFNQKSRLGHWTREKTILHSDRYSWLAAAAADEAIKQSNLDVPFGRPYRAACIIGSAAGGQSSGEKGCRDRFALKKPAVHPMFLPRIIGSSAAAHVGIEYGIKGPTLGVCSAGASAAHAISLGFDYIRHGMVDVAIVGGSDSAITLGALLAGQALDLLSSEGCFPFSLNRSGTVLSEAAGVLVIESEQHANTRGAHVQAEVCGYGLSASGGDMVAPDVGSMSSAMTLALQNAELDPPDIGYLNAYGTATRANDRCETLAIKRVFGEHAHAMGISSTKSMHGHAMGASGAIEVIACIEALRNQSIPPTIGLTQPDPECDLDYVPKCGRATTSVYAMSNSFGLGGLNAVLILGLLPAQR
ncbi:MAG: beta-ketoacyl-[acyl-carrier-protein] synthase family protein [Hyphomicrobiaceae bacterium]